MNKRLITTAVATVVLTIQIFATEGINLIGIGPVQQGTAGAGVASAKDSTWLLLNPAGLTDVEMGVDASFQYFAPVRTMNSTTSGGAGAQEDDSAFVIPSISGSFGCCQGENGFLGLGLYGTSGMGVNYDNGRFPGGGDRMTELSVAKLTGTYAYKFGDSGLSIGAGPILVMSRLKTDMLNPNTGSFSSGDWDASFGSGAIIGVNQKLGTLSIGGSYMTEQWMQEFDEYNSLLGGSLNLPQQLTVGAALNVTDTIELALDYRWVGWKELETLGDTFGWDSQNIVKAGITWGVTDELTLRGGISYGKSPIGEDTAFSNALFPAITETHLACGASYAWEKWAAHFACIHALENTITANGPNMGPMGDGTGTEISMYQNSLTAGVSYTF